MKYAFVLFVSMLMLFSCADEPIAVDELSVDARSSVNYSLSPTGLVLGSQGFFAGSVSSGVSLYVDGFGVDDTTDFTSYLGCLAICMAQLNGEYSSNDPEYGSHLYDCAHACLVWLSPETDEPEIEDQ